MGSGADVRRAWRWTRWASAALALLTAATGPALGASARRIVSLNLCTDQIVADLVPPERIASLSIMAADPKVSVLADRAHLYRFVAGSAEEVLALDPDLVLATEYDAPATVAMLRRLGRNVAIIPSAQDFAALRAAVHRIAEAVGEPERGNAVAGAIDARLSAVAARRRGASAKGGGGQAPTALSWEVNSLAADDASVVDAVMRAAGFDNAARALRLGPGGKLPLEALVARPPDVLVLANGPDDYRTSAADNLRHPALVAVMAGRETVRLPMPLWLCASPRTLDAVELLAAARERLAGIAAGR